MDQEPEIELGAICRDKVTGFKGMVICVAQWLHGCKRVTIQPQELKDGKPIDPYTFDSYQLEVVTRGKGKLATKALTGGPRPEPTRSKVPA